MRLSCSASVITTLLAFGYSTVNAQKFQMATIEEDGIEDSWIISMKPDCEFDPEQVLHETFPTGNISNSTMAAASTQVFSAFRIFAAQMPKKAAKKLSKSPCVDLVEQDAKVSIDKYTDRWGLDRIDQELGRDEDYTPPPNGGLSATAYVLDTGVKTDHTDLDGRASFGAQFVGESPGDFNGHGTHVAGTIGGVLSGVAKHVKIVDVKVLGGSGGGSWSGVIKGMDWVINHHDRSTGGGTINMSLGGGKNNAINSAVKRVVTAGISVVVAAGNSNSDACNYSPASAEDAITVGSTDIGDNRSSFSNYGGGCVNIFAPGRNILSTWNDGDYKSISGTSMASPHVCGVAALLLGNDPSLEPADVLEELTTRAVEGIVTDTRGAPNKLLQIGEYAPPEPTQSPVPTSNPSSSPSLAPTQSNVPSTSPTTSIPSVSPSTSKPTGEPTPTPTVSPTDTPAPTSWKAMVKSWSSKYWYDNSCSYKFVDQTPVITRLSNNQYSKITMKMDWKDQGWGNQKGRVRVTLMDGDRAKAAYTTRVAPHGMTKFEAVLPATHPIISNVKVGDRYVIQVYCGCGGGHRLYINNYHLKIPFANDEEAPEPTGTPTKSPSATPSHSPVPLQKWKCGGGKWLHKVNSVVEEGEEDICDITMKMKGMRGTHGGCSEDKSDQCSTTGNDCTVKFKFLYSISEQCVEAKACKFMRVDAYHDSSMDANIPIVTTIGKQKNTWKTNSKGVAVPSGCGLQSTVLRVECEPDDGYITSKTMSYDYMCSSCDALFLHEDMM